TATFRREHVETARAEVVRARAEALREREAAARERDALRQHQQRLDEQVLQTKEEQARARADAETLRERLDARLRRAAQREAALEQAAVAVETLAAEAAARRAEASALQEQIQGLARTAGRRQQEVAARERDADAAEAHLASETERLGRLVDETLATLERAAGLSRDEARAQLTAEITREARLEAAGEVKDARDEAKRTAQREAQKVILKAIQRIAATTTIEHTVTAVPLMSEDMKGRVIGREGRNIRSFEAATGIEVIVDDTPDAVLVSGFDPVRREVARMALVRLLADGRIHPARIEEVVEEVRREVEEEIVMAGEQAALELQIHGLHPELVRMVGRMKYRTSFGQNLLAHSIEVAKLAALMASELDLDARKAKRAGLLHDIGKVAEENLEQPHAIVGMELCRRYKEHPDVCNAVGAHHDEVPMATTIAPLVQAADASSGARPGARRESLERYVQRLKALEEIAAGFEGVVQAYAIQAGREVRVVVDTTVVSDALSEALAVDISRRIEREMEYPGQIKVTVIRELRAVAVAR
ncbi:MAG TPA: ribonuclease Y, partial [Rubricoccaceae bacterium]